MNSDKHAINFIGIGAHKSATTWLAHVLRSHPEIWIPPPKELHYFDRKTQYASPNNLASHKFLDRLIGSQPGNADWRKSATRDFLAATFKMDFDRLRWNLKYYTGTIGDDWYLNLFPAGKFTAVGEITPAYAMLSTEDISRVIALSPKIKIIYLLRDPIDRAWSHIRYDRGNSAQNSLDNIEKMKTFIDSPTLTLRGDYLGTLDKWLSIVPSDQFFIGYYDDIKSQPMDFLERLSKFLGINCELFARQEVNTNVMASQKQDIPAEIEKYLAEKYHGDLQNLEKTLGSHVIKWTNRSRDILNRQP